MFYVIKILFKVKHYKNYNRDCYKVNKNINFCFEMATLAANLLRSSSRCILTSQFCGRNSSSSLQSFLHTSSSNDYSHLTRNPEGKFNCTLIPGDGVGPELVINIFVNKIQRRVHKYLNTYLSLKYELSIMWLVVDFKMLHHFKFCFKNV